MASAPSSSSFLFITFIIYEKDLEGLHTPLQCRAELREKVSNTKCNECSNTCANASVSRVYVYPTFSTLHSSNTFEIWCSYLVKKLVSS